MTALGCGGQVAGGSADGAEVYAAACATCHGPEGHPSKSMVAKLGVRDLTDPALHERLSDADIRAQIENGSDNDKMPGFAGTLSDAQIRALVQHVRTLRAQ
jgi:mono/diheme cytochrome c family protein